MLKELIDFVDSILPSVPMGTKEGVQEAIAQFEKEGEQIKYLTLNPLSELSQGDIISAVPFHYFDEQKNKMVLVPVFPIESFVGNKVELIKNKVIDYMYIPDGNMANSYVDFEIMNTFSKDLIMSGLKSGRLKRIASLNQIGYYFFIIKLTVYLMRREDAGTLQERNFGFSY